MRPKLEYGVFLWNPYLKKHVDKLEYVENFAARMMPELAGPGYECEERLKMLLVPQTRHLIITCKVRH